MSAQQPVPGIMRAGATPASTSFSSNSMRSPTASEFASELVPNTARPTLFATSHLHWRTKRSLSGLRSALNGVTTGESTPVMRWLMLLAPVCVVRMGPDAAVLRLF